MRFGVNLWSKALPHTGVKAIICCGEDCYDAFKQVRSETDGLKDLQLVKIKHAWLPRWDGDVELSRAVRDLAGFKLSLRPVAVMRKRHLADDGTSRGAEDNLPPRSAGPNVLYCGIVEHVRGSVIVAGSSKPDDLQIIAQPLQPLRNLSDPVDVAVLQQLMGDVVRWSHYVDYEWQEEDE